MKTGLKLSALAIGFVSLVFWFFGGPHWGRTQMTETQTRVDPATGNHFSVEQFNFLAGIDFLIISLAASFLLFSLSFLPPREKAGAGK